MLAEIYVEALLVNKELADQVWEAWDKGEIDDQVAWLAWWWIADRPSCSNANPQIERILLPTILKKGATT